MGSQNGITFCAKAIGYALAISVVLCLALPFIAVVAYALLMLLSLITNYIGLFVYYVIYGPLLILHNTIFPFLDYCVEQVNCCCSAFVIPYIILFFLGIILRCIRGLIEGIGRLISERLTFRRIMINILAFWLVCLALLYIFKNIGFYDNYKDYSLTLATCANATLNSLISIFLEFKVYFLCWAPLALVVVLIIIVNIVKFLWWLLKFIFVCLLAGIRFILMTIKLLFKLILTLFKLILIGAFRIIQYIYTFFYIVLRLISIGITILFNFICIVFNYIYIAFYIVLRVALLGLAITVDWFFSKRRIIHICPNMDCGNISDSSIYECPHCGELLTNLRPSYGGIFYKKCPKCKKDVSVSCLTGRDKYSTACPKCNNTWGYFNFGNVPSSVFIVEGASQSGKTSLLAQMLIQWHSHFPKHVHFLIDNQKNTVKQLANGINEQRFYPSKDFCPSTPSLSYPEAYVMRHQKLFHSFLAYFYDTGDEDASSRQAGVVEPYFDLADGIFLVIDPWAERCVLDSFRANKLTRPQTYQYSNLDASAVIGRLCCKLDRLYTGSFNSRFDIPICVVVTKCDINRLDSRIGIDANYSQSSRQWAEQSQKVENYLENIGMYNFINIIKTRFKKYAFFAVSVLDDPIHKPEVVLNPLLWMIKNAH